MVKFNNYSVVFEEVPDKITLAFNITNCMNKCIGCHSPELRKDIGDILTETKISEIIDKNYGINCICFMGEGNDRDGLLNLIKYIKNNYDFDVGLYSGSDTFEDREVLSHLTYLKIGHYDCKLGPLNSKTTNQRMYLIKNGNLEDITERFWK